MRKIRCPLCGKDYKAESWRSPCPHCVRDREADRETPDPDEAAAAASGSTPDVAAKPEPKPREPIRETDRDRLDPVLAGILSFLILGLGQVYCRRVARGLFWMFGLPMIELALVGCFSAVARIDFLFALGLAAPLTLVVWIANIRDAYLCAEEANRRSRS